MEDQRDTQTALNGERSTKDLTGKWQQALLALLLIGGLVSVLTGCGRGKTVGEAAAPDAATTPLATILATPEEYSGQTVVMEGVLAAQCPSLCDFTYAEGNKSVTVYMGEEKAPRIQSGQPVRVTAAIHEGKEQVVFTAKGLEILPRKGRP
jgi:hypothetical protein